MGGTLEISHRSMSERKVNLVPGEYYHVYNRGNSKQKIFLDVYDYFRFIKLLFISNSNLSFKLHLLRNHIYDTEREAPIVNIGAYCLMQNHFHILISPHTENGLSKFMQKVTTGYSMYFNNKYDRRGTLFEGKFKAEAITDDRYLKYLYAYIHLNPMKLYDKNWRDSDIQDKEEAKKFIREYRYSSFPDYSGSSRRESAILNTEAFPERFSTTEEFEQSMFEWFDKFKPEIVSL